MWNQFSLHFTYKITLAIVIIFIFLLFAKSRHLYNIYASIPASINSYQTSCKVGHGFVDTSWSTLVGR